MDDVLKALNWNGRYQTIQYFCLVAPILWCPLHFVSFLFIGKPSPYTCSQLDLPYPSLNNLSASSSYNKSGNLNSNLSVTYGECSVTVINQSQEIFKSTCANGYDYEIQRERSFATEWDLVCEKSALMEVSQTILTLGMMVGAFLFAGLADRYGRRPVYIGCQISVLVFGILTAFVPNYTSFLCVRFLLGTTMEGMGMMSGIMLLELIPTERRAWSVHFSILTWTVGLLLLILVSYLCRDLSWRSTQLALAAFSWFALVQYWLTNESIRWLAANNRHEEAKNLLRKAAKMNNIEEREVLRLYSLQEEPLLVVASGSSPQVSTSSPVVGDSQSKMLPGMNVKTTEVFESPNEFDTTVCPRSQPEAQLEFSAFFTNRTIFLRTIIAMYMWFSDTVAYSGLLLLSSFLVDDLYLGFTLSCLTEIPAFIAFVVLCNRNVGRRRLTILSHLVGGVFLGIAGVLDKIPATAAMPWVGSVTLVMSLIGKFGLVLGFNAIWLYIPELFPTTIRSTAYGVSIAAGQVGGMVAPYSITVARHIPWLPGMIFALLCLSIPLVTLALPETGGLELAQRVDDLGVIKSSSNSQVCDGVGSRQYRVPREDGTQL